MSGAVGAISSSPLTAALARQATTVAAPFFQSTTEVAKVAGKSFLSSTPNVGQILSTMA